MNESVNIAKEMDAKRRSSSTHTSEEGIRRAQHDPERQLASLGDVVVGNIKSNGGTPLADSIATHLSSMHTAQRAPVLSALRQTYGNRCVQQAASGIQAKLVVWQPGISMSRRCLRLIVELVRIGLFRDEKDALVGVIREQARNKIWYYEGNIRELKRKYTVDFPEFKRIVEGRITAPFLIGG